MRPNSHFPCGDACWAFLPLIHAVEQHLIRDIREVVRLDKRCFNTVECGRAY